MAKILLGFEVPTGEPVYIEPQHLAIFGMTQLSGKTTTNEALITRSGARAITFITKRGESGFTQAHEIKPYFKSGRGWQYVESLVDVALGEKVKYEPRMRFAIMQVSRGMKDLHDVLAKAEKLLKEATKSWDKEVYSKLIAYLHLVLPELEKVDFGDKVQLSEGVNVMNLEGMKLQTQQLIIASTLQYVYEHLSNVIAIIPEAWEQLPQSRKTPVKFVAEQLIRKGASVKNYIWLDTQDIGGVDKTPLRQVSTWIVGRMMEAHEVERLLKQLLGFKVSAKNIQTLPLGCFYVTVGNAVKKVYVLPVGVPEEEGRAVAIGEKTPEEIRDKYLKPRPFGEMQSEAFTKVLEDFERVSNELAEVKKDYSELTHKYKQALADARETRKLRNQVDILTKQLKELEPIKPLAEALHSIFPSLTKRAVDDFRKSFEIDLENAVRKRIQELRQHPERFDITVKSPQTTLTVEKPMHTLVLGDEDLAGRLAIVYAEGLLPHDKSFTLKRLNEILTKRYGRKEAYPNFKKPLRDMVAWGFLTIVQAGKRQDYQVAMTPDEAKKKGLLIVKEIRP